MSTSRLLFTALVILAALMVVVWSLTDWASATSAPLTSSLDGVR